MAERDLALDCLLERIDRVVHHHEQLTEWSAPDSAGSIYPQRAERQRLAGAAVATVRFTPQPEPIRVEVALPEDPGPLWAWRDVSEFVSTEEPTFLQRGQPSPPWWRRMWGTGG